MPESGEVNWNAIIQGLFGSSPLAGILAAGIVTLWKKLTERDKVIEQKDKVIQELQEARVQDLREIAKLDD